jgi:hypothetical protein
VPDCHDNEQPPVPATGVKVATAASANAAGDASVPRWPRLDGCAAAMQCQALGSLLDPNEMNNSAWQGRSTTSSARPMPMIESAVRSDARPTAVFALDEALFALVAIRLKNGLSSLRQPL